MEKNRIYVDRYIEAYRQMKKRAVEALKEYGRELDFVAIGKRLLAEHLPEVYDEDIDDWKSENLYSCILEGKHEQLYCCYITKVRYNEQGRCLEVYLEDDEGYTHDWFNMTWVTFGEESVYMSILNFIDL